MLNKLLNKFNYINIGIYFILLSMMCYIIRDTIVKMFITIPPVEVVFFSSIFGLIITVVSLYLKPIIMLQKKPKKFKLLLFRGVSGFIASTTFFYNITHISLVGTVVFMQTSVIFSAILMSLLFSEKLTLLQWISIFVGFIGIILMVSPNGQLQITKLDFIGLFCGISSASAYISIRELRGCYESRIIVLSFLCVSAISSSICMLFAEFLYQPYLDFIVTKFVMPDFKILFLLLFIALFSTLGQLYKTKAYFNHKTAVIGIFGYLRIPIAFIIGLLLGDKFPELFIILGMILIILSCVMVSYTKYQKTTQDSYQFK